MGICLMEKGYMQQLIRSLVIYFLRKTQSHSLLYLQKGMEVWCNALRDNRLLYTMYIFKRRGQPLQDSLGAINAYKSLTEINVRYAWWTFICNIQLKKINNVENKNNNLCRELEVNSTSSGSITPLCLFLNVSKSSSLIDRSC